MSLTEVKAHIDDISPEVAEQIVEAIGDPIATKVKYDNTNSGLKATNCQGAIDEIATEKLLDCKLFRRTKCVSLYAKE